MALKGVKSGPIMNELLTGSGDGHCLLGDHFLTLAKRDVVEVFVHGSKTCWEQFNKTLQSQKLRHFSKTCLQILTYSHYIISKFDTFINMIDLKTTTTSHQ
jgi:hypothetical protein